MLSELPPDLDPRLPDLLYPDRDPDLEVPDLENPGLNTDLDLDRPDLEGLVREPVIRVRVIGSQWVVPPGVRD